MTDKIARVRLAQYETPDRLCLLKPAERRQLAADIARVLDYAGRLRWGLALALILNVVAWAAVLGVAYSRLHP